MNYNFKILSKCERLIHYYHKLLVNYPGKEIVLKQNIQRTLYELVEYIYSYSINQVIRVKEKYLKDLIIELSMLNYYIELSYERKFISKHQRDVVGRYLIEIRKMVFGVIQNEKDKV